MSLKSPKMNPLKMMPSFDNIFPPEVIAFTSRRPYDFSLTDNQTDLSGEQKENLSKQLNFNIRSTVNIRQVHSDKIIVVPKNDYYVAPEVFEEADGIVTGQVNFPILIRTADCVPVFLYDEERKQIGLVHAGWKGTQKEILKKALSLMDTSLSGVKIAFGPAIRECCYEVRDDVKEYFPDNISRRDGKYYLDLVKLNAKQAVDSGVNAENIADCGICTCCNTDYFSYRREGKAAGRMVSLMMLHKVA